MDALARTVRWVEGLLVSIDERPVSDPRANSPPRAAASGQIWETPPCYTLRE